MTLRLRLTAWYALALAAGLSLFAAAIWFSMRSSLSASLDTTMADHSRNLALYIRHEIRNPYTQHSRKELSEFCQGLPQGIAIELFNAQGVAVFSSVVRPYRHQRVLVQTLPVEGQTFRIQVDGSLETIDETLGRLRILLIACTPLVILIAASGAYWLSRRALRPVTSIIDAAQNIGIHNLSQRLTVPHTGDELQRLSETWNAVLARLESAVNRLSQFTADASHELRTPLAVIRATAELAARRSRSAEAYRAALNEVATESERMTQMVEDLLFLARCDAGAGEMRLEPLDLAGPMQDACQTIARFALSKRIDLRANLSPCHAKGNAAALRRMALVLLDNAIKYTPEGGRVQVTLRENRLTVSDTGIGIGPEALPRIFERFYQADPSRSNSGYGLGLPQARSIADGHGACIQATSQPGQGSVFQVTFPLLANPAPAPQNMAGSPTSRPAPATSIR